MLLAAVGVAGALIIGATIAFFSDTETSNDNTIQAGAIDLKVDSEAHYNGLVCRDVGVVVPDYRWREPGPDPATPAELALAHYDIPCDGTWDQTDLGATNQFFELVDVKPGDEGENTISLHVYTNDAWGRFVIRDVRDLDNTCTEPESEVNPLLDPECVAAGSGGTPVPDSGELAESITFYAWLDQGATPGFQNIGSDGKPINRQPDPGEGDNIWQCGQLTDPRDFRPDVECDEPLVILPGTVDENPSPDQTLADETHNIWVALAAVDGLYCDDDVNIPSNGQNQYGLCQGIANDGRMVGSTTYYFGLAWFVPDEVGNEAQTDSLNADLSFEVEQHRNNPTPFGP